MSSSTFSIETAIDDDLAEMESNREQRNYLKDIIRACESRLDDIPEED